MKTLFVRHYIYGHWHIGLCALFLYLAGTSISIGGYDLMTCIHVFSATQFIYTLHRIISSSRMSGKVESRYNFAISHRTYSLSILSISGLIALISFFTLPVSVQLLLFLSGLISLGYILPIIFHKRLRDIGIFKIVLISLVWGIVSILSFDFEKEFLIMIFFFLENFFFIFALTIPFDVRDQELDQNAKVSNLVNTIGLNRIKALMNFLILAALITAIALFFQEVYTLSLLVAMIVFYIIQFVLTRKLAIPHHEMYYLLSLDGLIMLKGLIYLCLFYFSYL